MNKTGAILTLPKEQFSSPFISLPINFYLIFIVLMAVLSKLFLPRFSSAMLSTKGGRRSSNKYQNENLKML